MTPPPLVGALIKAPVKLGRVCRNLKLRRTTCVAARVVARDVDARRRLCTLGTFPAAHRASEVGVAELVGHGLRRDAADAEPDAQLQVQHQVVRAVTLVDALTRLRRDLHDSRRRTE